MGTQRPKRPPPGHAMLLPRVGKDAAADTTQRALDAVKLATQQAQQTAANLATAVDERSGGRLLGPPQRFTASGPYTPAEGCTLAIATITGGGGAGGGAQGAGAGAAVGGGGASGVTIRVTIQNPMAGSVVVGAAGAPGAPGPAPGGGGGDSSLLQGSTTYLAKGGGGGAGMTNPGIPVAIGGNPQAGSSASDYITGDPGLNGEFFAGATWVSGSGGCGARGIGGQGQAGTIAPAAPATGNGSGGAGAAVTTISASGAGGSPGLIIIEEYS